MAWSVWTWAVKHWFGPGGIGPLLPLRMVQRTKKQIIATTKKITVAVQQVPAAVAHRVTESGEKAKAYQKRRDTRHEMEYSTKRVLTIQSATCAPKRILVSHSVFRRGPGWGAAAAAARTDDESKSVHVWPQQLDCSRWLL